MTVQVVFFVFVLFSFFFGGGVAFFFMSKKQLKISDHLNFALIFQRFSKIYDMII